MKLLFSFGFLVFVFYFTLVNPVFAAFTSRYPPEFNNTYVRATFTEDDYDWAPWYIFDPIKSLTDSWILGNSWYMNAWYHGNHVPPVRINVDLGANYIIKRMYYENGFDTVEYAASSLSGLKSIIIQGSNDGEAFANLDATIDTNWTDIARSDLIEHSQIRAPDPHYLPLPANSGSYRFYSIKVLSNFDNGTRYALRRIELQTEESDDSPTPTPTPTPMQTPVFKPGDANGDTHVDGVDYVIWLNHYSQMVSGGPTVGDFNTDGTVDGVDYVVWLNNYGM